MADILAVLASSDDGRKHLLFGEKSDHSDKYEVTSYIEQLDKLKHSQSINYHSVILSIFDK